MNPIKTDKPNTKSENDVARPGHWLSPDGIQPLPERDADAADAADPADTAQEAVHEVMTKDAAQDIAPIAGTAPLHAAKGDDDLTSKPPTSAPGEKPDDKSKH